MDSLWCHKAAGRMKKTWGSFKVEGLFGVKICLVCIQEFYRAFCFHKWLSSNSYSCLPPRKLRWVAVESTMNEDVSPIENGDQWRFSKVMFFLRGVFDMCAMSSVTIPFRCYTCNYLFAYILMFEKANSRLGTTTFSDDVSHCFSAWLKSGLLRPLPKKINGWNTQNWWFVNSRCFSFSKGGVS